MGQAHEIASLTLAGSATLQLNAALTMNNGGSMSTGTIIQRTAMTNGPITVTGGTFTWSGGEH
jgi:hypothetical protein